MTTSESIIKEIQKSIHKKVKVAITDIDGVLRGKYLHIDKFLSAAKSGFGFCNVVFGWDINDAVYDNVKYTGWHTGYPDANVELDLSTYRKIPWENGQPFFLGDFVKDKGQPLAICPRQFCKKIYQKLQKAGFEPKFGLEFEWFNFQETPASIAEKHYVNPQPLTPGMFGYSLLRSTFNQPFFSEIIDELAKFNVPIEGLHTETGPGVFEAALLYDNPIVAADRGVLFKSGVKELAYKHKIIPSFMAKWNSSLPGCSGHIHQSLLSPDEKKNLFYSEKDSAKMSDTFKHYLAGQMHCLPEILPMFAPTVNSYKRLVEGHWAPTLVTWAVDNRTSAFRVISGSSKSTRLETRVSGSDINPYLAIGAAMASGLYGIEKKLKLGAPIVGNGYRAEGAVKLSRNLMEAAEKMAKSEIAKELFGSEFVEHYTNTRIWEWRQFQKAVTNWETERYFEIV